MRLLRRDIHHHHHHVGYLDGWRGLAILTVLGAHFVNLFAGCGTLGVELFFALSGYLICGILFEEQEPLGFFFKRRLSRIYPGFLFFVTAMFIYPQSNRPVPWYDLFFTLTFLRTYLPAHISMWTMSWPISHLWSLNVEEHSYIWLALGAAICRRFKYPWVELSFFAFSLLMNLFFILHYADRPDSSEYSPLFIHSECASFGILAAAAYRRAKHYWLPFALPKFFALGLVVLGCSQFSRAHLLGAASLATPLCLAVAVNHLDETYQWAQRILSLPVLRWFGRCSFSIYLWQQIFYAAITAHTPWYSHARDYVTFLTVTPTWPWTIHLPGIVTALCATSVGALFFYGLENPLRNFLNQRWMKRPLPNGVTSYPRRSLHP